LIQPFNLLLRKIFQDELRMNPEQIGFDPPDENWRKYVGEHEGEYVNGQEWRALNIYLTDVRENRGMRTSGCLHQVRDGVVRELPPPRWLDCHYLITAWDPAPFDIARGVEPTLSEHAILSAAAVCLLELETRSVTRPETEPLTPRQIFKPDPLPADYPSELADVTLPMTILPKEGFTKLAEFWSSMGSGHRWKPAVYLVATLPLIKSTVPSDLPNAKPIYLAVGAGYKHDEKLEGATEKIVEKLLEDVDNTTNEGG